MAAWLAGDGFEDPSRFTHDVRYWATQLIGAFLREEIVFDANKDGAQVPAWFKAYVRDGHTDAIVEAILDDHEQYVFWYPVKEYSGENFAAGVWCVSWEWLLGDLRAIAARVADESLRQRDAQRFRTLDAWLRADIAGQLEYDGAVGGSANLPDDVRKELAQRARARARRLALSGARRCACGAQFMPDRKNAAQCDQCREIARRRRARP